MTKELLWQIPEGNIADEKKQILSERLNEVAKVAGAKKFANSLSAEDMVIMHHWLKVLGYNNDGEFFMLQTERLPDSSMAYLQDLEKFYGVTITQVKPDAAAVADYIKQYGLNGFYESVAARKACCGMRKVAPLKKILTGATLWVTGQRQGQGTTRTSIQFAEDDAAFGLKKYNPIFDWQEAEVFAYLKQQGVPLHPLYQRGYASIGCDPCSRAIKKGEDIRAGRWWWESDDQKECGINAINIKN